MPTRQLDFPVFDADNHFYETTESLTKHLDPKYDGVIQYVEVKGRTKIAVKGQISEYIPNPTFDKVAAPGAQEEWFREGNKDNKSRREILGKAIDSLPAYREPAPRVELMDELGIDRSLMWPTLASLVEERLRDDPLATHAVIEALNRWIYETWSFNFDNRIFPLPSSRCLFSTGRSPSWNGCSSGAPSSSWCDRRQSLASRAPDPSLCRSTTRSGK